MFRKWLDKHVGAIITIFAILIGALAVVLIYMDAARNIDNQVDALYEKADLVEQDFANAYELGGVTCYINKETNVIVFQESDCMLKVTYNKDGELLTKEFEDYRIGKNIGVSIAVVGGISIIAGICSAFLLIILDGALAAKEKRNEIKKQEQVRKKELERAQGL